MLTEKDIQFIKLTDEEVRKCIENACKVTPNIVDRADLHSRDYLERFINVLMGEIAEFGVIKWLNNNGKYAVSAVDKNSKEVDSGHDINVIDSSNKMRTCSIKSSLSVQKDSAQILKTFRIATKQSEIRDINIQVYFWLDINPKESKPRKNVPSLDNMAIIAWAGKKDFDKFEVYKHESRECSVNKLCNLRSMESLLKILK